MKEYKGYKIYTADDGECDILEPDGDLYDGGFSSYEECVEVIDDLLK